MSDRVSLDFVCYSRLAGGTLACLFYVLLFIGYCSSHWFFDDFEELPAVVAFNATVADLSEVG